MDSTKRLLVSAITTASIAFGVMPVRAETFNCFSDLAKRNGNIRYGECVPQRLSFNRKGPTAYDLLMRAGVNAAVPDDEWKEPDMDSAMINFSRAAMIAPSGSWQEKEALRGWLGASMAKDENNDYGIWLRVTGELSFFD